MGPSRWPGHPLTLVVAGSVALAAGAAIAVAAAGVVDPVPGGGGTSTRVTGRGRSVAADLGAAPSAGDPRLAERLAANLVGNAIRHNVAGGWVSASTAMRAGRAVLTVANSGPEVPPAQVGRLFEPFQRLGEDRVGSGGSGLGLSIVKAVAAAHDAWVHARALPGGGLEVRVHFPAPPAAGSRPADGLVDGLGAGLGERPGSGDGLQAGHLTR